MRICKDPFIYFQGFEGCPVIRCSRSSGRFTVSRMPRKIPRPARKTLGPDSGFLCILLLVCHWLLWLAYVGLSLFPKSTWAFQVLIFSLVRLMDTSVQLTLSLGIKWQVAQVHNYLSRCLHLFMEFEVAFLSLLSSVVSNCLKHIEILDVTYKNAQ